MGFSFATIDLEDPEVVALRTADEGEGDTGCDSSVWGDATAVCAGEADEGWEHELMLLHTRPQPQLDTIGLESGDKLLL